MNLGPAPEIATIIPVGPSPAGEWLAAFRAETDPRDQCAGFRFERVVCWAHVRCEVVESDGNTYKGNAVCAIVFSESTGALGVADADPSFVALVPPGTQLQVWAHATRLRTSGAPVTPLKRIGRGRFD